MSAERADSARSTDPRLSAAAQALAAAERQVALAPDPGPDPGPGPGPGPDSTPSKAQALSSGSAPRRRRRTQPGPPPPPPPDRGRQDREPDPEDVARTIVLRQLERAPRTRRQLADTLRRRGCEDRVAERVLDRMGELGLVDDEAYADLLVRSKHAEKGLAKRALAHELRSRGVADETISQALDSIAEGSERARAEQLVDKRLRTMGGLDPQVQARRLAGMLARKGYQPSVVYAVVRDALNAAPEHQRD